MLLALPPLSLGRLLPLSFDKCLTQAVRKIAVFPSTPARLAERGLARIDPPPQTVFAHPEQSREPGGKRRRHVSLTARPRQTRLGNIYPTGGEETFCGRSSAPFEILFLPPSISMGTPSPPSSLEDQVAMVTSKPPAPPRQGSSPSVLT